MSDDDDRTRTQLTDLFSKDKEMDRRVTLMEQTVELHGKMIDGINKTNINLEQCHKDAQTALFGDKKLGVKGLIEETKKQSDMLSKHEAIIVKVGIGIAVTVALLKYLGIWDSMLG